MRTASRGRAGVREAGTVVGLTPLKADPQRVRIMVRASGSARARCAHVILRDQAQALRIRVGGRWSAQLAVRIKAAADAVRAREAALRAIGRARSPIDSNALSTRLRSQGHPPRAVAAAIRQLRSDGWVID